MRTTLDLDDAVLKQAKARAAAEGRSLTSVIEEALRMLLEERGLLQPRKRVVLPVYGGSGTQPGIDLSDPEVIKDLMYSEEDERIRAAMRPAAE